MSEPNQPRDGQRSVEELIAEFQTLYEQAEAVQRKLADLTRQLNERSAELKQHGRHAQNRPDPPETGSSE